MSGFDNLGKPVPLERQVDALDTLVEEMGGSPFLGDPVIRSAAHYIERDNIEKAVIALQSVTDLTGAYRLLAVMCA